MNLIDKVCWLLIKDRKVLFVRSYGKEAFFTPGGKRESGESDTETLIREVKEELNVGLLAETINFLETFKAQAYGKADGVIVQTKCYEGEYSGTLSPSAEIEELAWFTSTDTSRTTAVGELTLKWLKERNFID